MDLHNIFSFILLMCQNSLIFLNKEPYKYLFLYIYLSYNILFCLMLLIYYLIILIHNQHIFHYMDHLYNIYLFMVKSMAKDFWIFLYMVYIIPHFYMNLIYNIHQFYLNLFLLQLSFYIYHIFYQPWNHFYNIHLIIF
jgi:hypothetical protein